jgi:hypothetical protein
MLKQVAFGCAILSLVVLGAATVRGGLAYPGYDHLTQYISELGANGAPTGHSVSLAFMVSGGLLAAFWLLCAVLFPRGPLAIIGFGLSALNGLGLLSGGVFPCDFECAFSDPSPAAALHEALGGLGYLCGVAGVFLVGFAARRWPNGSGLFVLSLVCGVPALLALGMIGPEVAWRGAGQRVLEVALAVWTLGVAVRVRRAPSLATA